MLESHHTSNLVYETCGTPLTLLFAFYESHKDFFLEMLSTHLEKVLDKKDCAEKMVKLMEPFHVGTTSPGREYLDIRV